MNKKTILLLVLVLGLGILAVMALNSGPQKSLINPKASLQETPKQINPSETFIEYTDPSGFAFSYPDNLSIVKNEIEDKNTYTDLQLSSKEVNGSLNLKISDTKLKTLDEWLKLNKIALENSKEVKLGNLKGVEAKTADRILLGALDQGVLFTIEMPRIEEDFWMKVYGKILTDFSFAPGEATSFSSDEGVTFEGEEVIE